MTLRHTKKFRTLSPALQKLAGWSHADTRRLRGAPSHEAAYFQAAQAGLAYDADAGWYVAERPAAAPRSPLDIRLEGPHATLVAAEELLLRAGFVLRKRSGPRIARGGVFLTYLAVTLPKKGGRT